MTDSTDSTDPTHLSYYIIAAPNSDLMSDARWVEFQTWWYRFFLSNSIADWDIDSPFPFPRWVVLEDQQFNSMTCYFQRWFVIQTAADLEASTKAIQ